MKKFVVLSTQRTGSTLLIKSLDSHPDILCAGELFFPRSGIEYAMCQYRKQSLQRRLRHAFLRSGLVSQYLDEFYAQPGYKRLGFKYMYSQARSIPRLYPSVVSYLHEHNIHVLHNIRRNYLRVLLSMHYAKKTGVYRSEKTIRRYPVTLRIDDLVSQLGNLREKDVLWADRFSSHPYLQVNYEDFVNDQASERKKILEFLELDDIGELTANLKKVSQDNLEELINNYDEVKAKLARTGFSSCFESD